MDPPFCDLFDSNSDRSLSSDASEVHIYQNLLDTISILTTENDELRCDLDHAATLTRRMTATEKAYHNLESEYQALSDAVQPNRAVAFIDGDKIQFLPHLVQQGYEGGIEAAKAVCERLETTIRHLCDGEARVTDYIFVLVIHAQAAAEQYAFEGVPEANMALTKFIAGFQSHKNALVFVTHSRQDTIAKLSDSFRMFAGLIDIRFMLVGLCASSTKALLVQLLVDTPATTPFALQRARSHTLASSISSTASLKSFGSDALTFDTASTYAVDTSRFILLDVSPSSRSSQASLAELATVNKELEVDFDTTALIRVEWMDLFIADNSQAFTPVESKPKADLKLDEPTNKTPSSPSKNSSGRRSSRQSKSAKSIHQEPVVQTPLPNSHVVCTPVEDYTVVSSKKNKNGTMKVDPSLRLTRQKVPPCNNFYLTQAGCSNANCNFSHNYKLTPAQVEELRFGARSAPCRYILKGSKCPAGDLCVFGHTCPLGANCKMGSECFFLPSMH